MSTVDRPNFIRRFDRIWARKRFNHISQAFFWSLLALLAGFALLCAADYWIEIEWNARAWSVAILAAACLLFGGFQVVSAIRRWSRGSTAVKIEQNFPELGQTVRTAVQFGTQPTAANDDGVAETLVDALEEHADEQTRPLRLDSIIPKARLWLAALAVLGSIAALAVAAGSDWEWRTATSRAMLGNAPYTTLHVSPGDCAVYEGRDQEITFEVRGRMRDEIMVLTREHSAETWTKLELTEDDLTNTEPQLHEYSVLLASIDVPLEYKVRVGELQSETYNVGVHYPLEIKKISATIEAPRYTALPEKTVEGGNLNAIAGSTIRLQVELDRAPATAELSLRDLGKSLASTEDTTGTMPLEIDGNVLTTTMTLNDHKIYSITAKASDGMELPANNYRIRIRHDQAPKVWFESPHEALEVHTLAEVLMRIRTTDDFGLSKAGVSFEINNEESFELISEDFETLLDALDESKPISLTTRKTLEKILPLEAITLSQKDSVTYYAFAEDNYPDGPHRTESDLRFIDIRPFRRLYRLVEPMPGMPGQQRDLANLDELIARQRFALNRTVRIRKRWEANQDIDLTTIDRLISFETEIADYTQRLAKFIEEIGFDGSDLLFQAEESMLAAVDSLSVGKYDTAELQEKDALRYLIEGRDKVNIAIRKNRNRQLAQRLRRFDRTQTQKLRRPKSEEEEAEEIARRVERLASRQRFVYDTLNGLKMDAQMQARRQQSQNNGASGGNNQQNPTPRQGSNGQNGTQSSPGQSGSGGNPSPSEDAPASETDDNPNGEQSPSEDGDMPTGDPNGDESPAPSAANDDATDDAQQPTSGDGEDGTSREDLEDQQRDIAAEAEDIARELQNMADATELIRQRLEEIAAAAGEVENALARGDDEDAIEQAGATSRKLAEAARNVRGVLAPEATQRVAIARDMAGRLGRAQRKLAEDLHGDAESEDTERPGGDGNGDAEERAEDISEAGKTLQDVLESIEKGFDPAGQASVSKIEALLNEGKVQDAVMRMQGVVDLIASDEDEDAAITSDDIADQMDVTSQRLDTIHRNVVAPRVEQIRQMQERAQALAEQLAAMETNRQIGTWHRKADELAEELENEGLAGPGREDLQEAMRNAGFGGGNVNRQWNWGLGGNGYYTAPVPYTTAAKRVVEELERHIQELVLGDLMSSDEGAVPPEYEALVDRYLEVLSSESEQ